MTTGTALSGMTAIREFCRSINMQSSEVTIIQLIQEEEFPAKKLGGVWESDKDLIIQWRKRRLTGGAPETKPEEKALENLSPANPSLLPPIKEKSKEIKNAKRQNGRNH